MVSRSYPSRGILVCTSVKLIRVLRLEFVVVSADDEHGIQELCGSVSNRFTDIADLRA